MARTKAEDTKKHVVFIHPDLGIGGAERLVVDAAVGLQSLGHKVTIFTSHCDKTHCFTEARDGTLNVQVRGDWWPSTIFGRFAILCAIVRQLHLVLSVFYTSKEFGMQPPTHIFVDQLSAGVPLLRCLTGVKILFYCHFPDKLLAVRGSGVLRLVKDVYRVPFDFLESWSTGCSDDIVVNSKFTASVVRSALPGLKGRDLQVVYPCVDTDAITNRSPSPQPLKLTKSLLLSINRFERKKDVGLAIKAFARLPNALRESTVLALAGGYDNRVHENVTHLIELELLSSKLGIKYQILHGDISPASIETDTGIIFLPSVSDTVKQSLLNSALLLIYTPRNEHFGIVPLEAMLNEVPVLAANEGGPTETVVDEMTGWLRNVSDVDAWTEVMHCALKLKSDDPIKLQTMGRAGRARVEDLFSKREMATRLDQVLTAMEAKRRPAVVSPAIMAAFLFLTLFITTFVAISANRLFQSVS